MTKIKQIRIDGFKSKNRIVEIDFSTKDNLTILFGDNGCGKTTFLRVIHAILSRDDNILMEENVKKIDILIEEDGKVHQYLIKQVDDTIGSAIRRKSKRYDWGAFPENISSLIFGIDRGISNVMNISTEQIEEFFLGPYGRKYNEFYQENGADFAERFVNFLKRNSMISNRRFGTSKKYDQLMKKNAMADKLDMFTINEVLLNCKKNEEKIRNDNIQAAIFNTLSDLVSGEDNGKQNYNEDIFKRNLSKYRKVLISILKAISKNTLQMELLEILEKDDLEEILDVCKNNSILLILFNRMLDEIDKAEQRQRPINLLLQSFNEYLSGGKKLRYSDGEYFIQFDSEETHSLNGLSSGERHLLSLLTGCIIVGQDKDIVMIDEPDMSLNITWKKNILSFLAELLPNTQIIVATHSSTLVTDKFDAMVRME